MPPLLSPRLRQGLWLLLALLLLVRAVDMALLPLMDSTEARYGEIARKMLETGDWITMQFKYGVPFWAKPPLYSWLSAAGMALFGANAFGARSYALLLAAGMLLLVHTWVKARRGADQALLTTAVLASGLMFFVAAGTVMTDTALALCTTLAMVGYWRAMQDGSRLWGYLAFVGLGLGLLAKGPIAVVLSGVPVAMWTLHHRRWRDTWQRLPWITGSLLMLAIATPWYWLAEHKTPGFLNYFIVGEHFGRFLHSGWQGDLYGHAHSAPRGTIWVYWLLGAAPWSFLALAGLLWRRAELLAAWREETPWLSYLLYWSTGSLLFFSLSGNIIPPYVLPALPAFAVLLVEGWLHLSTADKVARRVVVLGLLVVALGTAVFPFKTASEAAFSQKPVAELYLASRTSPQSELVYFSKHYSSAEFYTQGRARDVTEASELAPLLTNQTQDFIVAGSRDAEQLPAEIRARFKPLRSFDRLVLLQEIPVQEAKSPSP